MSHSTVCLTTFIFRGEPGVNHKRHVLVYFSSPDDPNQHQTVHAQRGDEDDPWKVDQIHKGIDWTMTASYIAYVDAGAVKVQRGQEMLPVDIAASISVGGHEEDEGWNYQNFALRVYRQLCPTDCRRRSGTIRLRGNSWTSCLMELLVDLTWLLSGDAEDESHKNVL